MADSKDIREELKRLSAERGEIVKTLDEMLKGLDKTEKKLKKQSAEYQAQVEKLKEVNSEVESLNDELFESNKAIKVIEEGFGTSLGVLRQLTKGAAGFTGTLLIGSGYVVEALGKTTREMGGFVGGLTGAVGQVTLLGTAFPEALNSAKGLSSEFGGLSDLTFETQFNTNLMAVNMGIGGSEAAKLVGQFSRLNNGSIETAQNLAASTKELAKANGLMPSQVMADVANSSRLFAEYGSQGGKNIGEAAVAAGKLGVNLDTASKVTDTLLDFESSITKELELGARLGRNINLNEARRLAYQGNIKGALQESLRQMGGIDAYNKMDIYQKRAAAAALGLSSEEMQKMLANMDKLNDDGSIQLSQFDQMKETLTALATGPLGNFIKGLGGAVIAMGQMNYYGKGLFTSFKNTAVSIARGLKNLLLWPIKKLQGAFGPATKNMVMSKSGKLFPKDSPQGKMILNMKKKPVDALKSVSEKSEEVATKGDTLGKKGGGIGKSLKSLAKGLSAMGTPQVLFGAANLIPTALGFTLMTAGALGLGAVALLGQAGGAGLTALAGGLSAFGASAPVAIIGIGLLALLGAALIPLTYALSLLSPLVSAFGDVILKTFQGIGIVIDHVSQSIMSFMEVITLDKVASIGLLSLAFMGLAASLMFLGSAGLFALPALLGISAAAGGLAIVADLFGIGGSEETGAIVEGGGETFESQVLSGIDRVIAAIEGGMQVNLDGRRVSQGLANREKRAIGENRLVN